MRPTYGLLLALFTALTFGVLPLILKVLVRTIDPYTLTWARFALAALALSGVRAVLGARAPTRPVTRRVVLLTVLAGLGLTGNYLSYQSGLRFLTPDTAQIVIQLSPAFLLAGGIFIYKEAFGSRQKLGLVLLVCGFLLFFWDTAGSAFTATPDYVYGIWLIIFAAIAWAGFALAQKSATGVLGPINTMRFCYVIGVILLAPTADFGLLLGLDRQNLVLLLVSVTLTAASYVTFSESLRHFEASRVSLILANVPLFTLIAARASGLVFPGVIPIDDLGVTGTLGALLVVGGSALGNLRPRRK